MNIKKILATLVLLPAIAFAWEPSRPVTVIVGNTPAQFAEQMKAEYLVYKKVVDTAGLKLD